MDKELRHNVILFVREEEKELYEKAMSARGVTVTAFTPNGEKFGWGDTMDAILAHAISQGEERIIVADDDLRLSKVCFDLSVGTTPSYKDFKEHTGCWKEMQDDLATVDMDIPYMGITARQFSANNIEQYKDNHRNMQLWSFYIPFFANNNFRFRMDDGPFFMSDVWFCLKTLTAGVRNRIWQRYVRDDIPGTLGGCEALNRNPEEHSKCVMQIARTFPELVEIIGTKQNARKWGAGYLQTRIKWSKAYRPNTLNIFTRALNNGKE